MPGLQNAEQLKNSISHKLLPVLLAFLPFIFLPFCQFRLLSDQEIIAGFVFILFLCGIAKFLKLITTDAALTAALLGTHLFSISGLNIWPLILFFAAGSLAGKLPGKQNLDPKAGKARDAWQVLANGGMVYLISVLQSFTGNHYEFPYLVSIAVATADTIASEAGVRYGRFTIDIVRLQKVPAGASGGVSLIGTLASAAAAFCIACFAQNTAAGIAVFAFGIMGSVADSILGSTLQEKYTDDNGAVTEIPGGRLVRGLRGVNNDVVNLLSNGLVTALAMLFNGYIAV